MSASRPIQVIMFPSEQDIMLFIELMNAGMPEIQAAEMFGVVNADKANDAAVTATRAPSSPMMFRSPSKSPVMSSAMSHDCGKEVEAPKPRGCH